MIPSSTRCRAWNLFTALRVAGPKYEVSIPGDPAPDSATRVCGYALRTFWRFITSTPVEPSFMFVLNMYEQLCVGRLRAADAETVPAIAPPMTAATAAAFIEKLAINVMCL